VEVDDLLVDEVEVVEDEEDDLLEIRLQQHLLLEMYKTAHKTTQKIITKLIILVKINHTLQQLQILKNMVKM
jgi:hypothetical protein